ncbi:MAG: hypothetical protein ABI681_10335 [Gemmatimonadales bacterium]
MTYDVHRGAASRTFTDSVGVLWRVQERHRPGIAAAQNGDTLVFESQNALRCVQVFPEHWHSLDVAALERLSWNT